jgi:hypothetical protein
MERDNATDLIFKSCEQLLNDNAIHPMLVARGYTAYVLTLLNMMDISNEEVKKITDQMYESYVKREKNE